MIISIALLLFIFGNKIYAQDYVAGDFYQHTTYTDGRWNIFEVFRKECEFGLD